MDGSRSTEVGNMQHIKDYLGSENARNKDHADLYEDLIHRAFGADCDVLVGHHITFEKHGHIKTENEVPSADTLLFDHDIMGRIFGREAPAVMRALAGLDCDNREAELRRCLHRFDHTGTALPYAA